MPRIIPVRDFFRGDGSRDGLHTGAGAHGTDRAETTARQVTGDFANNLITKWPTCADNET